MFTLVYCGRAVAGWRSFYGTEYRMNSSCLLMIFICDNSLIEAS